MYLNKNIEKAAADEDELQQLRNNAIQPLEEDDPHASRMRRMTNQIAALRCRLTAKQGKAIEALANGSNITTAAQNAGCFAPTVKNAMKNPDGKRLYELYAQLSHLRTGASLESRAALLWRIALREEETNPRTSIAAVDTLNKQTGVYLPQEFTAQTPTVVLQNFQVDSTTTQFTPIGKQTPIEIEGEWSPVTVDVTPDNKT